VRPTWASRRSDGWLRDLDQLRQREPLAEDPELP
jgi:hypothetical protein